MKLSNLLCLATAAAAVPAACHHHVKSDALQSNFAEVRIADNALVNASTGKAYTGTVVA